MAGRRALARLATLFPAGLLPDVTVGLVLGSLSVVLSISLAALMFGAELQAYMARTIGMVLTGGILLGLVVSLLTSAKGMIGHVQDAPAAVLGALAASMTVGVVSADERWLTTLALTLLTTIATGLLYFLVGVFRLGGLVRYLPYPVLGGFMAGTGWLLLTGGIGIMSGVHLSSPADVRALFADSAAWSWLPGIAFAVALLVVSHRVKHLLVWPVSLLGAVGVFYLVMAMLGGSVGSWREAGLLVGPFPSGGLFDPLRAAELSGVRWDLLATQVPGILTVAFVCLIAVLLNATGVQEAVGRKVDLNRELRAAGLGNMLGGVFGGMPGYQSMSLTVFNYTAASGGRVAAFIAVGVLIVTLFFGAGMIQFLPTVVIGGLVAYFGLGFLYDWLVSAFSRLPRTEYLIMLVIFVAIVTLGVLPGVGVGLVLAVVMFVISSSRTVAVRYQADLTMLHSRVSRPPAERALLAEHGHETLVIRLQGFLFFGTATALAERLERHGAGSVGDGPSSTASLSDVILDLERVNGVDSSGIATLGSIARVARSAGYVLNVCSAPAPLRSRIVAAAGDATGGDPSGGSLRFFDSLDAALESCEQRTLERHRSSSTVTTKPESADEAPQAASESAEAAFAALGLDLDRLEPYLLKRDLEPGETLIRRGEEAGALYFLVAGQLTASLSARSAASAPGEVATAPSGRVGEDSVRLETMRSGSLVGELAFYRRVPRGADVRADTRSSLLVLDEASLERMNAEAPALAAALHRQVAKQMAGRVAHLVDAVETLQR